MEHVMLTKGGIFHTLEQTTYSYTEQNGVYSENVRKTFLGQQWEDYYGQSWYSNHPDCPYANGRLKGKWEINGPEPSFAYSLCSEYGAAWKCEETLQMYDTPFPGQSTRIVHYYAENGDEVATDHQVDVEGEGFVSIDLRRMSYDASHRVIRTDYANGLNSQAEWACAATFSETDIRGMQTR